MTGQANTKPLIECHLTTNKFHRRAYTLSQRWWLPSHRWVRRTKGVRQAYFLVSLPTAQNTQGRVAEWLGRALQKLLQRFESALDLHYQSPFYSETCSRPGRFLPPLPSSDFMVLLGTSSNDFLIRSAGPQSDPGRLLWPQDNNPTPTPPGDITQFLQKSRPMAQ